MEHTPDKKIEGEILSYNYWEHFKAAKELSLVLLPEHPKRKNIEKAMREIIGKTTLKNKQ